MFLIFRYQCVTHSSDSIVQPTCEVGDLIVLKIENKTKIGVVSKDLDDCAYLVHQYEVISVKNLYCM